MATVTREQFIDNEQCIEWCDAVAAVKGGPGAPPAEAIEHLIACGDALAAALAAPPPDETRADLRPWVEHKPDCECIRSKTIYGVTLCEGGRCTCGLRAALTAAQE